MSLFCNIFTQHRAQVYGNISISVVKFKGVSPTPQYTPLNPEQYYLPWREGALGCLTSPQSLMITSSYSFAHNLGLLIGWFIELIVQTFRPHIVIYRRGKFVYKRWGFTSIYRLLSYPFRSLTICILVNFYLFILFSFCFQNQVFQFFI